MLPEDIQDYCSPMTIIGSDVVALYPNMEVERAAEIIKEAILRSPMEFKNLDLLECSRYVALNWTNEQCRASKIRRVLPWRRKTKGSRPGIRGPGPRGKTRGDSEQWIFPDIVMEEWEVRELVGTVVQIMTRALFRRHYYNFGGHIYHQKGGGPIGLRGTCAVARAVMQMFDLKFKKRLSEAGLHTWLLARYVDDARAFLQPVKPGWRYNECGLEFSLAWTREDSDLTPTELTRRVIEGAMKGIEEFLEFTYETCEDEEFEGWLPTLDTCFRINENNVAEYKYYEKPMVSTKTLQRRAAMEENTKMNILANDMMRRLLTTKEELGAAYRGAVVDQYGAKLLRSGYTREQTRKILLNGIKGFENKRRSRINKGRSLRRTAKMSMRDRHKKKLLERSNWYKKRKSGKEENYKKVEQKEGKRQVKRSSQ